MLKLSRNFGMILRSRTKMLEYSPQGKFIPSPFTVAQV